MLIANDPGRAVLEGTVTAATFLGPPLVVVGDGLTEGDPRWAAALAFAAALGAQTMRVPPVVGMTPGDVASSLDRPLDALSRFFAPAGDRPLTWAANQPKDGSPWRASPVRACGPFLSMPATEDARLTVLAQCGYVSGRFVRITCSNLHGIGCMAVGGGDPETRATPPTYDLRPPGFAATLAAIAGVWTRGGPVSAASYAVLQEQERTRFGISRRTHPALVPYLFFP